LFDDGERSSFHSFLSCTSTKTMKFTGAALLSAIATAAAFVPHSPLFAARSRAVAPSASFGLFSTTETEAEASNKETYEFTVRLRLSFCITAVVELPARRVSHYASIFTERRRPCHGPDH
jgi:hypothetical protein